MLYRKTFKMVNMFTDKTGDNNIALIAGGRTDLLIIERILQRLISKDLDINYVFPNKKKKESGGWGNVFKWLLSSEKEEVFEHNRWIIIHLDSDVFSGGTVPQDLQGIIRSDDELNVVVDKMKEIIIEKMGRTVYEIYQDKIFFAIAVREIECWLLPYLYEEDNKKTKVAGCLSAINLSKLCVRLGKTIDKENKDLSVYTDIMDGLKKIIKKSAELCRENPSAEIFISSLEENEEFINAYMSR